MRLCCGCRFAWHGGSKVQTSSRRCGHDDHPIAMCKVATVKTESRYTTPQGRGGNGNLHPGYLDCHLRLV